MFCMHTFSSLPLSECTLYPCRALSSAVPVPWFGTTHWRTAGTKRAPRWTCCPSPRPTCPCLEETAHSPSRWGPVSSLALILAMWYLTTLAIIFAMWYQMTLALILALWYLFTLALILALLSPDMCAYISLVISWHRSWWSCGHVLFGTLALLLVAWCLMA